MNLRIFYGKNIKIKMKDGLIVFGFVSGIDDASSNENNKESLTLINTGIAEYVSVNEDEIDYIELA